MSQKPKVAFVCSSSVLFLFFLLGKMLDSRQERGVK